MSAGLDVRKLPMQKRANIAQKLKDLDNVDLGELPGWNTDPCPLHADGWELEYWDDDGEIAKKRITDGSPDPSCRRCGVQLRNHQRIGGLWLFMRETGLLSDGTGTGKTFTIATLLALMKASGELGSVRRGGNGGVVVVPRAPALQQWRAELLRVMPDLKIALASEMTKKDRLALYMTNWDVLLVGPETFRNDYKQIDRFPIAALITDDVDAMRNNETDTSVALDHVGAGAHRYYITHATPLQKKLPELYNTVDALGGDSPKVFGTKDAFEAKYLRWGWKRALEKDGSVTQARTVVGYQNLDDFKRRIEPFVLRRTADELDDVTMPAIIPSNVMLDLYKKQREKYTELQSGIIQLIDDPKPKMVTVLSAIHYGAAICAGLPTLGEPDGPGASVKLDWIMDTIGPDGDLGDEKVVIFARLKNTIRALQARLDRQGIGYATIWGEEKSKSARFEAQARFWDDPSCRILLGTQAIEASLNLQVSRHLINVDMLLNPARMTQLAGRIKRQGSKHASVYVHNLLTRNTQEERYLALIEEESALADFVWDDTSELFKPLPPQRLLALISGGPTA